MGLKIRPPLHNKGMMVINNRELAISFYGLAKAILLSIDRLA